MDVSVGELRVAESDTSSGIGGGQLPRGVHHDDIELCCRYEVAPVHGGDVSVEGDALRGDLPFAGVDVFESADSPVDAFNAHGIVEGVAVAWCLNCFFFKKDVHTYDRGESVRVG